MMKTEGLGVTVMENKSNKLPNRNGLDYMVRSTATAKELHQRYKDILEPLSLFTSSTTEGIKPPVFQLKRPVTPIDQSVKWTPATLADLCQLIQRRIAAKSDVISVSIATQQALGGMIIEDVKLLWEEFVHCSHDITLTNMENKELSRRITTHIITVCEQLFLHYLHMVDVVRRRSVFTDEANLSRLKAQLTLDCIKFLNIPSIKRRISREIKALRKSSDDEEALDMEYFGNYKHMVSKSMSPEAHFTLNHLFNLSRPKKAREPKQQTIETDLQEINENMPHLDLAQVYNVLSHKGESAGDHRQMEIVAVRAAIFPKEQNEEQLLTKNMQPQHHTIYRMNFQSNPNLSVRKAFSKEMGIFSYTSGSQNAILQSFYKEAKAQGNDQKCLSVADDLQKLLQISTVDEGDNTDPETTLPPLIQALTYDDTYEIKKQRREKILMELVEEERKEKLKRRIQQKQPEHAQPATVNIKVSKKMIARTADVRLSDRMFIDSVYLQIYPTIYNHFVGEIDSEMVKLLDSNLSHGEELQEIYKELLNVTPDDYLLFDQDPMIAPPAVEVDLSKCFISSTLFRRKKERAINPELKLLEPGYGTERYLLIKKEVKNSAFESEDQSKKAASKQDYLNHIFTQERRNRSCRSAFSKRGIHCWILEY
ncbi:coiled-coil domain-containing protein 87 isoform X2 [Heterodontus francisci]|uniref:coiled-coil domain-containing protein 87 isoform X2 n=1 Tax=Heterodontus francisci TaxID=7792 RepID=UPI00355BE419